MAISFTGKRTKPCFQPTGKRNRKSHIRLTQSELTAAAVLYNDDPSNKPGDRLMVLKFGDDGMETKHFMMEADARALGEWLLKITKPSSGDK